MEIYILLYIRGNHEDGILVTADVKALALAYGVELGTLVSPDDLAVGIGLVTGFLDVMLAGTVSLGLKSQGIIADRKRKPQQCRVI